MVSPFIPQPSVTYPFERDFESFGDQDFSRLERLTSYQLTPSLQELFTINMAILNDLLSVIPEKSSVRKKLSEKILLIASPTVQQTQASGLEPLDYQELAIYTALLPHPLAARYLLIASATHEPSLECITALSATLGGPSTQNEISRLLRLNYQNKVSISDYLPMLNSTLYNF